MSDWGIFRINWYVANSYNLLSVCDQQQVDFDLPIIHRMARTQQKLRIKHLDIAWNAHAEEQRQEKLKRNHEADETRWER